MDKFIGAYLNNGHSYTIKRRGDMREYTIVSFVDDIEIGVYNSINIAKRKAKEHIKRINER